MTRREPAPPLGRQAARVWPARRQRLGGRRISAADRAGHAGDDSLSRMSTRRREEALPGEKLPDPGVTADILLPRRASRASLQNHPSTR